MIYIIYESFFFVFFFNGRKFAMMMFDVNRLEGLFEYVVL